MTGFGRGTAAADGRELTVEMKSVNNRFLDVSVRLPRLLMPLEELIKRIIGQKFARGKFDVMVSYSNTREDRCEVAADIPLAKAYYAALCQIGAALELPTEGIRLRDVASFPNVLNMQDKGDDEGAIAALLEQAVLQACEGMQAMRAQEGARLCSDLMGKLDLIEEIVRGIDRLQPVAEQAQNQRLMDKMREYMEADEQVRQRVIAEAALIAEKRAIDEELVRLGSHIAQFRGAMEEQAVGRKLDFVVQEMNREVNTIGSKCNDAAIANLVIQAKSELEKVREQVQNLE